MSGTKVYIVHLRQPKRSDPNERRADPFFEFGSFGCTGCHSKNLLHLKHAEELPGARLAFAQGGSLGFRLILLTPSIKIKIWAEHLEARWERGSMPFRYSYAPVLVANEIKSDFPLLEKFVAGASRDTIQQCFSSRFRSRATPLSDAMAQEIVKVYQQLHTDAGPDAIAKRYNQAMPYDPSVMDKKRHTTYLARIAELRKTYGAHTGCSKSY